MTTITINYQQPATVTDNGHEWYRHDWDYWTPDRVWRPVENAVFSRMQKELLLRFVGRFWYTSNHQEALRLEKAYLSKPHHKISSDMYHTIAAQMGMRRGVRQVKAWLQEAEQYAAAAMLIYAL